MEAELCRSLQEWLMFDKNEITRKQIAYMKDNEDWNQLRKLLCNRMAFGTAGLRAKMGPGYAQMNDLTIIQTTQGLLKYALRVFPHLKETGIIIGYDARHNSKRWAHIVANIFVNGGSKVYLFRDTFPTPLLAYGVRHFKTSIGIMITASHNPRDDNGYKVYWSNGAQIISPIDKEISDCIKESLIPNESSWDVHKVDDDRLCLNPMPEILHSYCSLQKQNISFNSQENRNCKLQFVYTAMHGVGWQSVQSLMASFGFGPMIPVLEQVTPDPDFPTVDYPNPEEGRSALNLAFKRANSVGSPVIFANDPDADRLAVAEIQESGKWKIFTGNELGALLGWWLWSNWRKQNPTADPSKIGMLSSTVSSKILKTLADREGFYFEETLTGFKWMGNRADELSKEGIKIIFAFEEAIGFMCSDLVWDKDGVSALATVAELTSYVYDKGLCLSKQLQQIYQEYGQHISKNGYYFCYEPLKIVQMFERIRHWPNNPTHVGYPTRLGRFSIVGIRDLTTGYDNNYSDLKARLPVSSSSQCITFTFDNGVNLTIRTSGTEPKIKFYSELRAKPDSGTTRDALTAELQELINQMVEQFYEPDKNGFIAQAD